MHAVRAPGYHTHPMPTAAEQLNHVSKARFGSSSKTKVLCKTGDFQRVPSNQDSLGMEPLQCRRYCRRSALTALVAGPQSEGSIALFGDDETAEAKNPSKIISFP